MVISKAVRNEYESVRSFCHSMIEAMKGIEYHPKWQKDIYEDTGRVDFELFELVL